MEFRGKTAIATGAASGMALLFAEKMAREGANVVLTDVNAEAVEAAAAAIRQAGGSAVGIRVDVRDHREITAAVGIALEKFGRIDILLNSAGGASSRVCRQPEFKDASFESIEWGIDVNLKGAVLFVRAVIGQMFRQEGGVIINMGSVDGVTGSRCLDYSAAKSGMIGLTRSIAVYGSEHKVRSVCVSPGPVLTRPAMAGMKTLLGRAAEPEEIVDLIMYLCSDKAAFISGCNYSIDGARSCGGKD